MTRKVAEIDTIVRDHEKRIYKLESNHLDIPIPDKSTFQENTSKYQTNFVITTRGNGLKLGSDLTVKIRGAESVSGTIKDIRGKLLQIAQSHSKDEDNDAQTINFTLKVKRFKMFNYYIPKGEYFIKVSWWDKDTQRQGYYNDKFAIV